MELFISLKRLQKKWKYKLGSDLPFPSKESIDWMQAHEGGAASHRRTIQRSDFAIEALVQRGSKIPRQRDHLSFFVSAETCPPKALVEANCLPRSAIPQEVLTDVELDAKESAGRSSAASRPAKKSVAKPKPKADSKRKQGPAKSKAKPKAAAQGEESTSGKEKNSSNSPSDSPSDDSSDSSSDTDSSSSSSGAWKRHLPVEKSKRIECKMGATLHSHALPNND